MLDRQVSVETYEARASFLREIYISRYDEASAVGDVARSLGASSKWDVLRNRESHAWGKLFDKWGIDGAALVAEWEQFKETS